MLSPFLVQVAQSFLTALQNDERANYQLDVKFQESYLNKVVSLLQCQLSEGAVSDKDKKVVDTETSVSVDGSAIEEIEEGELPNSHGEYWLMILDNNLELGNSSYLAS